MNSRKNSNWYFIFLIFSVGLLWNRDEFLNVKYLRQNEEGIFISSRPVCLSGRISHGLALFQVIEGSGHRERQNGEYKGKGDEDLCPRLKVSGAVPPLTWQSSLELGTSSPAFPLDPGCGNGRGDFCWSP